MVTEASTEILVQLLAISRMGFVNSLRIGVLNELILRLQPTLKLLHQLPKVAMTQFKVMFLAYKALSGQMWLPEYNKTVIFVHWFTMHAGPVVSLQV